MKEKLVELIDYNLSDLLLMIAPYIYFYSYRVMLFSTSC